MKKKIILVSSLMLTVMSISLTGCGNNETKSETNAANESNTTNEDGTVEDITAETADIVGFDLNRIINNIILDGEKIHLPITLNELGDEYTIDDIWDMETGYDTAILLKNGKQLAVIMQVHDEKTDVRDKPFYGISSLKSGMGNTFISFDGISEGDNIEKVKEMYGEPTEFRMDKRPIVLGDVYDYEYTDNDGIRFNTNEKGEIIYMRVSFKSLGK